MAYSIKKEDVIKYPPSELYTYRLIIHEWIDNLNFMFSPKDFLSNSEEYIQVAKELFKKAGWQGDGEIELIWIPPFVFSSGFTSGEEAFGIIVWHVKQQSDGISWLLSPREF